MQETKRFRLLTILLAVVTIFALGIQIYAAMSKSVTQDGITATLVTDKDSYQAGESVEATVKIENNSGKNALISVQITVPSALKLAGASTFETVLANGQVWTSAAGSSDSTGSPTTGDNTQVVLWSAVAVFAIAGLAALLVYGKNRKTWISMLLCVVMIGGLMAVAVPAQAASVSGSMNLSCSIQLDGQAAEVTAVVNYVISDEDETLSESAYYVVWDDFTFGSINSGKTEVMSSSWDLMIPGGEAIAGGGNLTIPDYSEYAGSQAQRAFNAISHDFTMEFTMRATTGFEDAHVDIRNGETTAIRFAFKGDKLYLNDVELGAVPTANTTFKLHISPANGTFTLSQNGITITENGAAKEFAFLNGCAAIDRLFVETNEEETGAISFGTVRVYVGYYVNEKFLDGTTLVINDEWTVTGDAATIYKTGTQGPDKYNALLKDGASISRDVAYAQDGAWVEYQHLMEENVGEFRMTLTDADGNAFVVATKDGKFGYYNGDAFVGLYDCVANMWYHVMLKQTDEGTELYLNHKLQADKLPNIKFTNMSFSAAGGEAMLDDIVVKDWLPLPDDYVPTPVAVEKEEGAQLVGLQSCNLWVEGEHFGYDWLTDWEERTPVLGYYDEISSESADWELKFKIEHGIDFELYCWYRPTDGQGEPIKMSRNSRALHEGYMNAEYSDQMKFAITWESGSGGKDLADFKENIVPYWIEQYFKDGRYLVIDNKPLIGMYNINKLKEYFGGTIAGVKEAMDYLRQACVDAGFDGAYIIMCNDAASSAQEIAQASFDGQYAYTWGSSSNLISTQTKGMEGMQAALEAAGWASSGVVPTVSQGFWSKAWDRDDGNYASVETFREVLEWVKEDFMPTLDQTSIGSKVVLLDNWNEYGEGHFIMPSSLAGFGYVDAIKTVFGDGEACDEAVQHVVPTGAQCDRIQHMYIQDRHVVLVDKDGAASDVAPMEGYNWTFEVDGDTEGWAVGYNDGRWIKQLKDWAVKNGDFYGLTFTPDELAAMQANGDFGTLSGAATADPSLMSPDNLGLNASQAIAIKVRMKGVDGVEAIGKPAIYFITEEDQKWSNGKMVDAFYEEGADGYAEVTFNMTTNTLWEGTIKQIRFDPINRDGAFWIDSIQIMKRVEGGDAEIYKDGNRVYTAAPIETVDGDYMFPLDEIDSLLDAYIRESLAKDRLYISTGSALFEFPYEGDTKLIVNGEPVVGAIGLVTINDMVYVSISDLFENIGTVTDSLGGEHPAYTITITPATANAKAKVYIKKYVDSSILKAYYFASGTEDWTWGGGNTTRQPAFDGEGSITMSANGTNTKLWSPQNDQFNVNINKADYFRLRIKLDEAVENPTLKIDAYGDETTFSYTYNITLTKDMLGEDGFYTVLVSLEDAKAAGLKAAAEFDRVCIWWYNEAAGGEQSVWLDSFEILDLVEDDVEDEEPADSEKVVVEESPYTIYDWDFTESQSGWVSGGLTGLTYDDNLEALKVTCNPHGTGYRMDVWSSNYDGTKQKFENPLDILAADATHVLIRIQTEEEVKAMALTLQYMNEDGSVGASVDYTADYVTDVNGDLYALVDLTKGTGWDATKKIGRLNLFPIGKTVGEADNGKVVYITSVEVLDKNWYIEFDSVYFTNGEDGFVNGGTTVVGHADYALQIAPPSNGTDYNPRFWSLNNSGGVVAGAYEYTKEDVTHIRVRVKATVPTELPATFTEEDKAALAEITSEEMKLLLEFTDGTRVYVPSVSYEIGTEAYQTLTWDCTSVWPDGKKLARVSFEVFDGGNELLCKAGTVVSFDSVQFLRRTSEEDESPALKVLIIGNSITQHGQRFDYGWAGDWGMAATSPDKDYVHLLEDKILAKNGAVEVKAINISEYEKYFYDWSLINDALDKYANWNADIIIATFGANVKNGANESDSSYENNYVFSTAKYKKIIDKFNSDGDAKVIAGATVLTSEQIVKIIKDAAAQYGYTYVDMTEWTAKEYLAYDYEDEILAYYQQVTGDTTKTEVYSGVLGHPGDKGMEKIAEELWTALEPMIPQGIPAVDEGGDEGGESGEEERDILLAYYFDTGAEGWANGGAYTLSNRTGAFGLNFKVGEDADSDWQNGSFKSPAFDPVLTAGEVGSICIKLTTTATAPKKLKVTCYAQGGFAGKSVDFIVDWGEAVNGVYTIVVDCAALSQSIETLGSIRIYPVAEYVDETTNGEYWLESVEFIRVSDDEEVPVTPDEPTETYTVAKGWYFDSNEEGWLPGGAPNSHGYDATKTAYKLETKVDATASLKGPDVSSDALTLEDFDTIRIQLIDGTPNAVFTINTVFNNAAHTSTICNVDTRDVTLDENGNATILIDCSNATLGDASVLQTLRINVTSADVNTCYIDSVELLKQVDALTTTVLHAWDFADGQSGWVGGGATGVAHNAAKQALQVTVNNRRANVWSGNNDGDYIPEPLNISAAEATSVVIRVESNADLSVMGLEVQFVDEAGNSKGSVQYKNVRYSADENGKYVIVDLTSRAGYNPANTIGRINIYPIGHTIAEADNGKVVYITSVEIIKMAEATETPDEPTYTVTKGWYFDSNAEDWSLGGNAPTSYGYDAVKTAYKLETAAGKETGLKGPDVSSEALTLEDFDTIRIQLIGGTPNAVFTIRTVFNNAAHSSTICTVDTRDVTLDENGNATILIDCSNATLGEAGVLQTLRINVTSADVNTCYFDSIELLKKD